MRVLFLRHAEAVESSGFEGSDLERPLTGKGRRTMKAVARCLARRFDQPDRILTSQAERARATAELLANAFGGMAVEERADLNPGARLTAFHRVLAEAWKKEDALVVLVGHEPDFSTALSDLVAGGQLQVKLKKAACAEVELTTPTSGRLRALLDPALVVE